MSHDHSHGHVHGSGHSHSHAHAGSANQTRVGWAAVLTGGFMVVEAVGGLLAGSLALLADAGHMLTDSAALVLAWLAFRIARRPSDWKRTYGFHRFQVLAAYSNGLTLFFIAVAITWEAVRRLWEPGAVLAGPMLVIAVVGLCVNIAAYLILHGADRESLNVRGAILHVVGDLLGSAAAIAAALVILWTGWTPIDPLLSVLVAILILRSAWFLIAESGHILLEAAPRGLDVRDMETDLKANVAGVTGAHHIHAWSLSEERRMATLHVTVADLAQAARIAAAVKARLHDRFGIAHATVEVEDGACSDHTHEDA
jgi:cobalt-zinc-cadmium efflux system protein